MAPRAERFPTRELRTRDETALLWTGATVARWGIVAAAATITVVVTWYVISGQTTWNAEVPTMDIGIFSVIVASAAHISFLQAGRRAVGVRRRELLGEPAAEEAAVDAYPTAATTTTFSATEDLVASPGLRHFHFASCPLAAGRGWPAAERAEHLAAQRTPCGVCRP